MTDNWRPTTSGENLRTRAGVLASIRAFFSEREILEVETPLLASASGTDLHLQAMSTRYRGPGHDDGRRLWLQTSPEFAMKRLLAAGTGPIYQLCKAFRDGEAGSRHNPEFTILEWYRPGWDHHRLMDEVADLLTAVLGNTSDSDPEQEQEAATAIGGSGSNQRQGRERGSSDAARRRPGGTSQASPGGRVPGIPFHRVGRMEKLSYAEAFQRHVGIDPHTAKVTELIVAARDRIGGGMPDLGDDRDGWLDLLMSHLIEPLLGRGAPTFIFDYPASQAALARVRPGDPPVAERFETFVGGFELANGYHELTDPDEQRRRFEADLEARRNRGLPAAPIDNRFLEALEHGMPDCAGVALGVDRLAMLAAGAKRIDDVIAFPIDRA